MFTLAIDEALDRQLEIVSAWKGRAKSDVIVEVLRHYVQTEKRKQQLLDPALTALYSQLADEDVALAGSDIEGYAKQLEDAERMQPLLLSESALAKDWLRPEEEEAWRDL